MNSDVIGLGFSLDFGTYTLQVVLIVTTIENYYF